MHESCSVIISLFLVCALPRDTEYTTVRDVAFGGGGHVTVGLGCSEAVLSLRLM
jgi:hypothetical protein